MSQVLVVVLYLLEDVVRQVLVVEAHRRVVVEEAVEVAVEEAVEAAAAVVAEEEAAAKISGPKYVRIHI